MFAQRQILRALRTPVMQRRFAATVPKAGETAFAAERRAVKEHAAESTGGHTRGRRERRAWGGTILLTN